MENKNYIKIVRDWNKGGELRASVREAGTSRHLGWAVFPKKDGFRREGDVFVANLKYIGPNYHATVIRRVVITAI